MLRGHSDHMMTSRYLMYGHLKVLVIYIFNMLTTLKDSMCGYIAMLFFQNARSNPNYSYIVYCIVAFSHIIATREILPGILSLILLTGP